MSHKINAINRITEHMTLNRHQIYRSILIAFITLSLGAIFVVTLYLPHLIKKTLETNFQQTASWEKIHWEPFSSSVSVIKINLSSKHSNQTLNIEKLTLIWEWKKFLKNYFHFDTIQLHKLQLNSDHPANLSTQLNQLRSWLAKNQGQNQKKLRRLNWKEINCSQCQINFSQLKHHYLGNFSIGSYSSDTHQSLLKWHSSGKLNQNQLNIAGNLNLTHSSPKIAEAIIHTPNFLKIIPPPNELNIQILEKDEKKTLPLKLELSKEKIEDELVFIASLNAELGAGKSQPKKLFDSKIQWRHVSWSGEYKFNLNKSEASHLQFVSTDNQFKFKNLKIFPSTFFTSSTTSEYSPQKTPIRLNTLAFNLNKTAFSEWSVQNLNINHLVFHSFMQSSSIKKISIHSMMKDGKQIRVSPIILRDMEWSTQNINTGFSNILQGFHKIKASPLSDDFLLTGIFVEDHLMVSFPADPKYIPSNDFIYNLLNNKKSHQLKIDQLNWYAHPVTGIQEIQLNGELNSGGNINIRRIAKNNTHFFSINDLLLENWQHSTQQITGLKKAKGVLNFNAEISTNPCRYTSEFRVTNLLFESFDESLTTNPLKHLKVSPSIALNILQDSKPGKSDNHPLSLITSTKNCDSFDFENNFQNRHLFLSQHITESMNHLLLGQENSSSKIATEKQLIPHYRSQHLDEQILANIKFKPLSSTQPSQTFLIDKKKVEEISLLTQKHSNLQIRLVPSAGKLDIQHWRSSQNLPEITFEYSKKWNKKEQSALVFLAKQRGQTVKNWLLDQGIRENQIFITQPKILRDKSYPSVRLKL